MDVYEVQIIAKDYRFLRDDHVIGVGLLQLQQIVKQVHFLKDTNTTSLRMPLRKTWLPYPSITAEALCNSTSKSCGSEQGSAILL